jgi:hypothetical protein
MPVNYITRLYKNGLHEQLLTAEYMICAQTVPFSDVEFVSRTTRCAALSGGRNEEMKL